MDAAFHSIQFLEKIQEPLGKRLILYLMVEGAKLHRNLRIRVFARGGSLPASFLVHAVHSATLIFHLRLATNSA
nr:hypothetical protein SHINE37_42787 [Rhizobiaceae bacterium]